MVPLPKDHLEAGTFVEGHHEALLRKEGDVIKDARIPRGYLWVPMARYCGSREVEWGRYFHKNRGKGCAGLVYLGGGFDPPVAERCLAIAGALNRNFVRARVFTLLEALEYWGEGDLRATCLVIPNFLEDEPTSDAKIKGFAPRRPEGVSDLLLSRFREERLQTVLAAPSMGAIGKAYGSFVRDHVEAHFEKIEAADAQPQAPWQEVPA